MSISLYRRHLQGRKEKDISYMGRFTLPIMKKASDQNDPRLRVNYGKYAKEFPELVTPDGEGWLIRHVEDIVAFVESNPDAVRKEAMEKAQALKEGFREQWAKKLRHMLVPPFAPNTKGAWVLRFDDILADALELGPLKNKDFDLSEDVLQRLAERTPKGVPVEASVTRGFQPDE